MSNLTNNELKVLKAFDRSEYSENLSTETWLFSVRDHSGIKGKAFSGTVSSLVQKGYVATGAGDGRLTDDSSESDATLRMTYIGVLAFLEAAKEAGFEVEKEV